MKAQGSAEYLVLLAAALLIALAVVGILAYYPSTGEEAKKTQSDIYWTKAYPIAVIDAQGYASQHVITVKNLASEKIYLQGIDIGNRSANMISWAGTTCLEFRNCSIPLGPGREVALEYDAFAGYEGWVGMPLAACGLMTRDGMSLAFMNSYKKYAQAEIHIYYSSSPGGALQVEGAVTPLFLYCRDYDWRCSVDQNCDDKYGGTLRTCDYEGFCSLAA